MCCDVVENIYCEVRSRTDIESDMVDIVSSLQQKYMTLMS